MSIGKYSPGQTVIAKVTRILPSGAFVTLPDGTEAYIRRRELSLAGDLDPRTVVNEGQQIQAIILQLARPGRLMELSLRAILPDPWKEFVARFRENDVVIATVKDLVPGGAFAQITPGVDGFIPLEELAPWKVEGPEKVVWPGDRIEAMITRLDPARQKVWLSIRQWMACLGQREATMERLRHKAKPTGAREVPAEIIVEGFPSATEATRPKEIQGVGPVLVVEDDDAVREPLVRWLNNQGCLSYGVRTAYEALDFCCKQGLGLILVDLALPETDGLSLIRQLRDHNRSTPVAVMSSPEMIAKCLPSLQELEVAEIFPKPLDQEKIQRLLSRLARGERPKVQHLQAISESTHHLKELSAIMHSGQPLAKRFQEGLKRLVEITQAEEGIIFHLDPVSQKISIAARTGIIPLNEEAIYSLLDSPVKDIIREGGEIWENRASQEPTGRFRKLLDLLPFASCLGVPIEASGQTEYALFLFHREADAFSHYRLRDARAMAALFAVALESQALDRRIQDLSRIFLSGHLAAAFGHEVYNKISGLDLQFRNLLADFERLGREVPGWRDSLDFLEIKQALERAVDTVLDLKRTVADFRRLMETGGEAAADVNQAVRQAEALMRPLARRAKVEIRLELAPDLPIAIGSPIGLQQVFLNLMLNAVQHMENKPGERRLLQVVTAYEDQDGDRPVKVRFSDTGPGIHRQLWEKIFALGFTTKPGGSGLGLYIARSLVESMGGRIFVEESLVPLGTTFLVELPAVQKG